MKLLVVLFLLALSSAVCAQQPAGTVGRIIDTEAAKKAVQGECIAKDALDRQAGFSTIILQRGGEENRQDIANALIVALGIIPPHAIRELEEPIPEGWRHAGFAEDNGHHPFRRRRIITEIIKPVVFCTR